MYCYPIHFGLRYNPPTLAVEYAETEHEDEQALKLMTIDLPELRGTDVQDVCERIQTQHPKHFGAEIVNAAQLSKLIKMLMDRLQSSDAETRNDAPPEATQTRSRTSSSPAQVQPPTALKLDEKGPETSEGEESPSNSNSALKKRSELPPLGNLGNRALPSRPRLGDLPAVSSPNPSINPPLSPLSTSSELLTEQLRQAGREQASMAVAETQRASKQSAEVAAAEEDFLSASGDAREESPQSPMGKFAEKGSSSSSSKVMLTDVQPTPKNQNQEEDVDEEIVSEIEDGIEFEESVNYSESGFESDKSLGT